VMVPWLVYARESFGTAWPNTLAAKVAQGRSGLWQPFVPELFTRWLPQWSSVWGPEQPVFLNPIWWLVLLGLGAVLWTDRRWLVIVAWIIGYVVGYGLLGVPSYPWYSLPVTFVAALMAGLGVVRLPRLLGRLGVPYSRVRLGVAVLVGCWMLAAAWLPRVDVVREDPGDPRSESYLALAEWVRNNTDPGDSVAFMEIGYLGYFTPNPIVDLAGLVTPGVAAQVQEGDFATGFWRHEPDYFLYLPDFDWALAGITSYPRFGRDYRAVATVRGPYGTDFTVYGR